MADLDDLANQLCRGGEVGQIVVHFLCTFGL